ncbi:MAG TPA: beta-ketoacyl-ACP synthase III [Micromonosporaceae bacterium]|nr:beta-ketoacyl-ACP synthase III [Micromonosporaceae bacterium]
MTGTAAVIAGIGTWLPPRVVDNAELSRRLDTSDEWIRSRTGIRQRHVVEPGMSTADLAVEAGARALKSADGCGVDTVVLATTTPDHPCPSTAPEVANRLGLAGVAAFDLNGVCAGFIYALAAGAGLVVAGVAEGVLVIGADTFSTLLDPTDRSTVPIFGDGAGAVVLRRGLATELGALGPFDLGSHGGLAGLLMVPAGGSRQRSTGEPAGYYFRMVGKPVFRQAVERMAASARVALGRAGWTVPEVDRLVAHQANARILRAVGDELDIPPDRVVRNVDLVGNTVAASIPLAMADAARDGLLRPGDRVLACSFGGGLTWGSTTLRWPDLEPV